MSLQDLREVAQAMIDRDFAGSRMVGEALLVGIRDVQGPRDALGAANTVLPMSGTAVASPFPARGPRRMLVAGETPPNPATPALARATAGEELSIIELRGFDQDPQPWQSVSDGWWVVVGTGTRVAGPFEFRSDATAWMSKLYVAGTKQVLPNTSPFFSVSTQTVPGP